ncbi:hypothetical protein [Aeoliella sp.]|uniref:hypothetical protein n=1 Tax=Aeoliella sp. TaxID=2795800 RepID=UPI003CCC24CA
MRLQPLKRIVLPDINGELGDTSSASGDNRVWFEGTGWRGYGLLLELPGHHTMEIAGRTGVRMLNTFAALEVDLDTPKLINLISTRPAEGIVRIEHEQAGSLGRSVLKNTSSEMRHVILVGSHAPPNTIAHGDWNISDYRILHDSNEVTVVGWRNEIASKSEETDSAALFGDMCAVLHVSPPSHEYTFDTSDILFDPPAALEAGKSTPQSSDLLLNLKPDEQLVLLVANSSLAPSVIEVIEHETNQVVWKQEVGQAQEVANAHSTRAYTMVNHADLSRRFRLRHLESIVSDSTDVAWTIRPFTVRATAVDAELIGFEDSADTSQLINWEDSSIQVFHFKP